MSDNYELTYYGNLLIEGDIESGLEAISYAYFEPKNTDTFTGNEEIDTLVGHLFKVDGDTVGSMTSEETVRPTQGKTEEVLRTKSEPIDIRKNLDPIIGSSRAVSVTLTSQIRVDGSKDYTASKTKPFTAQPTQDGPGSIDSGKGETYPHPNNDIEAKIGGVELEDEFSDPTVDVVHTKQTTEHEIVPGHTVYTDEGIDFVVQALGRNPPEISVTAWVTQAQLSRIDNIVDQDIVEIETARYIGATVPRQTSVPYSRVYHEKYGWIFEVTLEFMAVEAGETTLPTNNNSG